MGRQRDVVRPGGYFVQCEICVLVVFSCIIISCVIVFSQGGLCFYKDGSFKDNHIIYGRQFFLYLNHLLLAYFVSFVSVLD